jgi:two-component system sensor kinase FixL
MPSNQIIAVMDAAVDAVILIDHSGLIRAFNRAAEQLFGWNSDEVLGRNVSMLMPEPDRSAHDRYLAGYLASGVPKIIGTGRKVQAQRRDGSVLPVHLSVGRVSDTDPPQFVGFVRDLTAEEQARRSSERLMQVSRMATIGEMAAGIAHELNQPLAAITNYAYASQRFLAMAEPDLEETREAVREIAAEALRAGAIIRRVRSLVRGDEAAREAVPPKELVDDARGLTVADARAQRTSVRLEFQEDAPTVFVHRAQITQVLLNLFRNALESLGDSNGEREILVRCQRTGAGDCEIAVCDNGPGVAPQIVERMFDPFRTTKRQGTGLGLPMSQTIAQAHGGSVRYEPAQPHGACFILTLPAAEVVT